MRRAMVRPGRDLLAGTVEVDESYWGGLEEGLRGRNLKNKALIAVAVQEDGRGIGRIRMKRIEDASGESLLPFVEECIEPGSVVHTDGWPGYSGLKKEGYVHQVTVVSRQEQSASELMPRVHRVMSLLKRWLLGTHQGAVSHKHLDYYLDEFTFRFNRRKSKSRGKLLSARPAGGSRGSGDLQDDCSPGYRTQENRQTTRYWGYLSQPYTHLFVFLYTSITGLLRVRQSGSPVKLVKPLIEALEPGSPLPLRRHHGPACAPSPPPPPGVSTPGTPPPWLP